LQERFKKYGDEKGREGKGSSTRRRGKLRSARINWERSKVRGYGVGGSVKTSKCSWALLIEGERSHAVGRQWGRLG